MGLEEESKQHQQQQEEEAVDVFDQLPDALILEIFNRVQDARSLSACTTLCKRFEHLVTQTDIVSLQIIRRNKPRELTNVDSVNSKPKAFFGRFILNPIQSVLHRMFSRKTKACSHCSDEDEDEDEAATFKLPNDLLKNFKEIKSLSVKLPGHDGDISPENGSGALLKWKAEFGRELESCVILGATGFREKEMKPVVTGKIGESLPGEPVTRNLTNKQLKKRVVWTISCLIASSARHHMLKRIVSMNPMIKDVKISDGSKQGTIRMNERQVVELREEVEAVDEVAEEERTKVPAVVIKMWYLPVLELPESGCVMKGATLAVIRPAGVPAEEKEDDVSLAMGAFEEKCMGEAVRKLIERKKSYTLEMNSF